MLAFSMGPTKAKMATPWLTDMCRGAHADLLYSQSAYCDDDNVFYLILQKQQPAQRYIPIGYFPLKAHVIILPSCPLWYYNDPFFLWLTWRCAKHFAVKPPSGPIYTNDQKREIAIGLKRSDFISGNNEPYRQLRIMT